MAAAERSTRPAHAPALDGVRGLAIALVLVHHTKHFFAIPEWMNGLSEAGWSGVDLFFVLSGFLISTILLRGKGRPRQLRTFWARRALRIFPLAYLVLGVLYVGNAMHLPGMLQPITSEVWWWFALYGGNLWITTHGWPLLGGLAVLWSLAIEEQFYMVWPLVVRFLPRVVLPFFLLLLVVLAPFARAYVRTHYGGPAPLVFTLGRADALAVGGLLAMLVESPRTQAITLRVARFLALPGLVLGVVLAQLPHAELPPWYPVGQYSFVALCYAPIVAAAVRPGRVLTWLLTPRALRTLGERSYGVYMWHYMLGPLTVAWFGVSPTSSVPGILTWLVLVWALTSLVYRYFERPLLELKKRFE